MFRQRVSGRALNGNAGVISKLNEFKSKEIVLCISVITVTEVLALSTLTPTEIRNIESFFNEFVILSVTANIAKQAATIRRKYKMTVPDALIASTAQLHLLTLVTADAQLSKVPRLKLINIK